MGMGLALHVKSPSITFLLAICRLEIRRWHYALKSTTKENLMEMSKFDGNTKIFRENE
jgi:hypothetical protein